MKNYQIIQYCENIIRVKVILDDKENLDTCFLDSSAKALAKPITIIENKGVSDKIDIVFSDNSIQFKDKAGSVFLEQIGSEFRANTESPLFTVENTFKTTKDEYLYGFGNVNGMIGINGSSIKEDQVIGIHHLNCSKCNPMFFSNKGYGILFNQTCNGKVKFTENSYTYESECSNKEDYFVILGSPQEVIKGYRLLTGKASLLPKESFGFIQSKNRYETQKELINTVHKFEEKQIPLDGVVIDYRWWGDNNPWNNMAWEYSEWEDPKGMMAFLEERKIQTAISIWPDFEPEGEVFQHLNEQGFLLPPKKENKRYAYDASNEKARKAYTDLIAKNVYDVGIYSIWLDANEPEPSLWEISGVETSKGNSLPLALMYPFYDSMAIYESQEQCRPNMRVNTLSRGSVAGIQKYGVQSWSGDIPSTFEQLRAELGGIINYHCSGLPFFSTDTGGYFGINTNDPIKRELFLRWLEVSCFNTIMRVHGRDCEKFPWSFGAEYEQTIVFYIRLREMLMDYIYSETIENCLEDTLLVKPLIYDYPSDDNCYQVYDTFKFGDSLLVSPVLDKGVDNKQVYFPAGEWYDFYNGECVYDSEKSGYEEVNAPIEKIPVFAKSGSIIVMDNTKICGKDTEKTIVVYGGSSCEYVLCQDDGISYNYKKGEVSQILFSWNEEEFTLTIGNKEGVFESENFSFNVVVIGKTGTCESGNFQYNNQMIKISTFNPSTYQLHIPTIEVRKKKNLKLEKGTVVGHWNFGENEGGAVKDSSGYHNHGALMMCNWCDGYESSHALDFVGYSPTVACGSDESLDLIDNLNIFIRTKIRTDGVLLSKGGFQSTNGYMISAINGELIVTLVGEKEFILKAPFIPSDDWNEIEVDFSLEQQCCTIYIDGKRAAWGTCNTSIGITTTTFALGKNEGNADPVIFKGILDEVIVKC